MPHLITNRKRQYTLKKKALEKAPKFLWEASNSILYLVGGLIFVLGSVFFLPAFSAMENVGAWLFVIGSLAYLIVTGHDLVESLTHLLRDDNTTLRYYLEFTTAIVYVIGTLLFTVGSVFFLSWVGLDIAGGWCFIIGSGLFVAGATVNVVHVFHAGHKRALQMLNATAVTFVVGSTLFLVASFPYTWKINPGEIEWQIFGYAAGQYIVGSVLFFLGGCFNFYRAWVVENQD